MIEVESIMNSNIFYEEVTITRIKDEVTNTTYYISKVPKYDSNGELLRLKHGFSFNDYDKKELESPRSFTARNAATLVANCSTYSTNTMRVVGTSIYNGVIQQELSKQAYNYILAIGEDNTLKAYPPPQVHSEYWMRLQKCFNCVYSIDREWTSSK